MSEPKDNDEDFASLADGLPEDFIAYNVAWLCPRRFVRVGSDDWQVLRWSDRWTIFDSCGDLAVADEYNRADQIFVRQRKIR